jgi:glycosyltransferase involved in cell wall biosynthesis
VRTTTIAEKDFFFRTDTCLKDDINILYTGRLDVAKGLRELVKAVAILRNNKFKIKLHFASWEDDPKKPVEHCFLDSPRKPF